MSEGNVQAPLLRLAEGQSQLIKKPGGTHSSGAGCLGSVPEYPVSSDDGNTASVTNIDLRHDGLDDRVVPRPYCVDSAQAPVLSGRDAAPRDALEDQDNLVI